MSALGAVQAASVSGSTDFEVDIPEVLVLYHWDKARLDITGNQFVYNDNNTHIGSMNMGENEANINDNPLTGASPVPNGFDTSSLIDVTLKSAWAVRSISSDNVTLSVAITDANHVGTNGSLAVVSDAKVSKTDIPSKWEPTVGDITFKLDLSKVTKPGLHESADETFELTLTGN